jgi:hypothetical protein
VDVTICQGRILLWEGELLLNLDEQEIIAKAKECAEKLWDRM